MQYLISLGLFFWLVVLGQAAPASCVITTNARAAFTKIAMHGFSNMRVLDKPIYGGDWAVVNASGAKIKLAELGDKAMLVNFWASWCGPCRQELPDLAALKTYSAAKNFSVITVNMDNVTNDKITQIFKDVKAENLPIYRDQNGDLFNLLRSKGLIFGLPVSLVFNKQHCLIAVINGAPQWNSEQGHSLVDLLASLS